MIFTLFPSAFAAQAEAVELASATEIVALSSLNAPLVDRVLRFNTWALGTVRSQTVDLLGSQPLGPFTGTGIQQAWGTSPVAFDVRQDAAGFHYLRGANNGSDPSVGNNGFNRELNLTFAPETQRLLLAFRVRIESTAANMPMVHVGGGTTADHAGHSAFRLCI